MMKGSTVFKERSLSPEEQKENENRSKTDNHERLRFLILTNSSMLSLFPFNLCLFTGLLLPSSPLLSYAKEFPLNTNTLTLISVLRFVNLHFFHHLIFPRDFIFSYTPIANHYRNGSFSRTLFPLDLSMIFDTMDHPIHPSVVPFLTYIVWKNQT